MKTRIVGITGGIASGKSTVTQFIRKQGYQVIDADSVVHELQKKGQALYVSLVDYFGTEILDDKGDLNRPFLAQKIFASPETLEISSQLQGKIIRQELFRLKEELSQKEFLFFMDIPLLIESDYVSWFDDIILVTVSKKIQKERLMKRNGLTEEEVLKRLSSQFSTKEKKKFATFIVDNNGSILETQQQVAKILKQLTL